MKVSLRNGSKLYICDSCYAEVFSLICRRIDGKDWDICFECHDLHIAKEEYLKSSNYPGQPHEEEVKNNVD